MLATRPSTAIQRGAASASENDRTSEAGAGPVFPHAQPHSPTALPHVHSPHLVAPQTRHQ